MRRKKVNVGIAFSDFVDLGASSFSDKGRRSNKPFHTPDLLIILPLFILGSIFSILAFRLFYIQVVQGSYYKNLSNNNRTRTVVIAAPRGIIFDRQGKPLVRNVPVFEDVKDNKVEILPKADALKLLSDGKSVTATVSREYLYKSIFAHVLGYTGQISENELNHPDFKGYAATDFVGKMGLEAEYEKILQGQTGRELYEVNAGGEKTRFLGRQEAIPGGNIDTTLDLDIQTAAAKAFEKIKKGAIVVSDPRDGGILALYSKPTFDSNLFTHSKSYIPEGDYKDVSSILLDSENQPLLNRAIGGAYPPGSTFKLVTATAGLESNAITPDTIFDDTGQITVGGATFGNWYFIQYGRTEGPLNVLGALKRSNDIFFYKTAQAAGVDTISSWARKLGAGSTLGIDLSGEVPGTVPTVEWKKSTVGEQWYLGDTFNYGIGQGYLLTTPLQVNTWTAFFANGGTLYQPHLLKDSKKILQQNIVDKKNIDLVREGMMEACDTGGVAWPLFGFKVKNPRLPIDDLNYSKVASDGAAFTRVKLGCKTGTAEIGDIHTSPHAWITVFAPFYNPEIVVTILVENGGEGSSIAGPIAKDILTSYFEKKQ
ncbi:MAG: penicillin-binding protein 2 [Candidatus Levyibacteriota bacterium]